MVPAARQSRRRRDLWKAVLLLMGLVVAAVWIVQAPRTPSLAPLGLFPLVIIVLATDVLGIRSRLPLLRSRILLRAVGGWSLVVLFLVATELFAISGLGTLAGFVQQPAAGSQASAGASSATAPSARAGTSSSAPVAPGASTSAPPPAAAPTQARPAAAKPSGPLAPAMNLLAAVITGVEPSAAPPPARAAKSARSGKPARASKPQPTCSPSGGGDGGGGGHKP